MLEAKGDLSAACRHKQLFTVALTSEDKVKSFDVLNLVTSDSNV